MFPKGIAFIGGEYPCPDLCKILVQDADLIVAADSGLIAAEAAGVMSDFIVGDMDSLDNIARFDKYPKERIIRYPTDKDCTDTELALQLLFDKGCTETLIIGGGGGRIDHLFAIRSLFERERAPDRWVTASEDIFCVKSELKIELRLMLKPQALVSVFPVGEGTWSAKSRGLKWVLDDLEWTRGFFGISNVAVDGNVSIYAERGRFMVITQQG
jgi:thiamine pyrophosphokinase